MSRSRATSALALALVAMVAALAPTAGATSSPSAKLVTVATSKTTDLLRARTCQAPGVRKAGSSASGRLLRKPTSVVACEQPPRSEIILPLAKSAVSSDLAQMG